MAETFFPIYHVDIIADDLNHHLNFMDLGLLVAADHGGWCRIAEELNRRDPLPVVDWVEDDGFAVAICQNALLSIGSALMIGQTLLVSNVAGFCHCLVG
ncbi:hypothetical protein ACLOJK_019685 [Asimina triloba]